MGSSNYASCRPDANSISARGGGTGLGDDAGGLPDGQSVIPKTGRIDTDLIQRQWSEMAARMQQSKIRHLDQTRIEDLEGTLFSVAPSDLFSAPTSKEAGVVLDQIAVSVRDDILRDGDFRVDVGDGKGLRSVSDVLDDFAMDREFAEILDLCGRGG